MVGSIPPPATIIVGRYMQGIFEQRGYFVIKNAITSETAKLLSIEFEMLRDNIFNDNGVDLKSTDFNNDWLVEKSFSWYSPFCFESLMVLLKPKIELIVGKQLYPTYSYARIYHTGAELVRHKDRHNSEYAVTITISIDPTESNPWHIYMQDRLGIENQLVLDVGDLCLYKGNELEHWRLPYSGKKQIQAFLFYTEDHTQQYDGRPMLGSQGKKSKNHIDYEKIFKDR
jgi:hypothetical protein